MKKLLSILAAAGLVATASSSVVSCTKKESLPTFHDVSDIHGSFLADNQVLKDLNKKDILGTVANMFKNPMDLLNISDQLEITNTRQLSSIDDGIEVIYLINISRALPDNKGTESSDDIQIKVAKNTEYFSLDDVKEPYPIDLTNDDSIVVSTIMNEGMKMLSVNDKDRATWETIESKGQSMMSLDEQLLNKLADKYSNMTPGFDTEHNNLRYDSVAQQIKASYCDKSKTKDELRITAFPEWKEKMYGMNTTILNMINTYIKDKNGFGKGFIVDNEVKLQQVLLNGLNPEGKHFFSIK